MDIAIIEAIENLTTGWWHLCGHCGSDNTSTFHECAGLGVDVEVLHCSDCGRREDLD